MISGVWLHKVFRERTGDITKVETNVMVSSDTTVAITIIVVVAAAADSSSSSRKHKCGGERPDDA